MLPTSQTTAERAARTLCLVLVYGVCQYASAALHVYGCDDDNGLEHTYISEDGVDRYHVRAPRSCVVGCSHDPHSPAVCPSGYYEKDFHRGCQNCTGGCPNCESGEPAECVLDTLFPNACRYTGQAIRRFYKMRHCQKCHSSCGECMGPSDTDCTRCPPTGLYWPVNKQCKEIKWTFVHGPRYQCFDVDHCHLGHESFVFSRMPSCSIDEVQLFREEQFCLECQDKFCLVNCTYGMVSAQCAFRDLGNGYHCGNVAYPNLAVKARACVGYADACESSPCPESYQCRSTLDWQGYACDCVNSTEGPNCPRFRRPRPGFLNTFGDNSTTSDDGDGDDDSDRFTTLPVWTAPSIINGGVGTRSGKGPVSSETAKYQTPTRREGTALTTTMSNNIGKTQANVQVVPAKESLNLGLLVAVCILAAIVLVILGVVAFKVARGYRREPEKFKKFSNISAHFARGNSVTSAASIDINNDDLTSITM